MNMADIVRPRATASRSWTKRALAASPVMALTLAMAAALALFAFPGSAHAAGSNTIRDVYGVDRNELVTWLQSHEHDSYYIGTPYRPFDWRSPNGDINGWGKSSDGTSAGMNCTGFVWHALCAAHGNRDDIQNRLPALSGWKTAINSNDLESYTFATKQEMLASGVLEKGDVIWIWDGWVGNLSNFNHIGFFWGDTSGQDLFWHSAGDHLNNWNGINQITEIQGKANVVVYQVVKLGGTLNGGISLTKSSTLPNVTDGNANYNLGNATYGLFDTSEAAASHNGDRALRTFTTDPNGSYESEMDIPRGSYYVAETSAPVGYALDQTVYPVEVPAGDKAKVGVADVPVTNPMTLWASKRDIQTLDGAPQGSATLQGALFEIRYYDGYYDLEDLPGTPTRTWVVSTNSEGKAVADDSFKVSGDDFYHTANGQVTIPLGTVAVREVKAPGGYLVGARSEGDPGTHIARITGSSETENIDAYLAPEFADDVMRGGVVVGKIDRQNGSYLPQGSARLDGAVFSIVTLNEQPVIVEGTAYRSGSVVKTVTTSLGEDGSYIARTGSTCLPVGTYAVYETESTEGYLYDATSRAWTQRFEITDEGQMADLTDVSKAAPNRVIRGDFEFSKVNGQTSERLGSVPFLVTSKTTGESHVMVTDENGLLSTAANWNSHAVNTNSNDNAVTETEGGYAVNEEALDPLAGVWFNGRVDVSCPPDDSLGALPYDTYTVEELPVKSNEGLSLVTFDVRISRDGREIDLGTVDDNAGPLVGTSLADENGVKLIAAGGFGVMTDTVEFANLDISKRYTLQGTLHLVTENGEDGGIVAEGSTVFQPRVPTGTVGVDFSVDTSDLAGARIVAFEQLIDDEGMVVASHEELMFEGQTVRVPAIGTSIANKADGDKRASADQPVELVDTVSYQGLTPGDTYTLTGTLHVRDDNGGDGGVAVDASGKPIVSQQSFTAEESTGTVQVTFTFAAPDLGGKTVVAFEELTRRGTVYATHADINDEGQSIELTKTPEQPAPPAEEESTKPEQPADEQPVREEAKPMVAKASLPKTGDLTPVLPIVALVAGAVGIGAAALYVRSLQRGKEIRINRGPQRW